MKNDFYVDMAEQNETWYFSIDDRDRTQFLYSRKNGLMRRDYRTNPPRCVSRELPSLSHAGTLLTRPLSAAALKAPAIAAPFKTTFTPARILRENEAVLQTLRQLKPVEWRVIFRAQQTHRLVMDKTGKEKKNRFTHSSILVKFRLHRQKDFIETGEGVIDGSRFNRDGLCSRIVNITENHRAGKFRRLGERVPVILNSGDGAILFHELLGHSLEADHIYHRRSPLRPDDIGKPIVSDAVTLTTADPGDPFFAARECDDEGHKAASPVLVENGVLRNLIGDTLYSGRLNLDCRGHCRTEDFTRLPMPRMYALYLKPGRFHPGELEASTPLGVYAGEFGEGNVYFDRGIFTFHIREAWLIEKGKRTQPLGGVMVQGNILDVLNSVEMVADDFRFDKGISHCLKNGQTLNVRVGQPSVKIANLCVTKTGTNQ